MLERKEKKTRRRRRERNPFRETGMPVERLRAKGRLMNIELSERDKTQPSKKEGKELKNPDTTGIMKGV
jgi:hypothetical protein